MNSTNGTGAFMGIKGERIALEHRPLYPHMRRGGMLISVDSRYGRNGVQVSFPPPEVVGLFTAFSFFSFYVRRWGREFRGASEAAHAWVNVTGFGAILFGTGYVIFVAVQLGMIAAAFLVVASFLFRLILVMIEGQIGAEFWLGVVGLAAVPALGVVLVYAG